MKLAIWAAALAVVAGAQPWLTDAEQAHLRGDLKREREILRRAAASSGPAEIRLAWLEWRFYGDHTAAASYFSGALKTNPRSSAAFAAQARFETARRRFATAQELARSALAHAATRDEREAAITQAAATAVEEAFETDRTPKSAAAALDAITGIVRVEPGRLYPSRLMYGLAVLLHDRARSAEALRSYYWGRSGPPLYPEAGLAGAPADVVAYSRFCRRVRALADEIYRRKSIGDQPLGHLSAAEQSAIREGVLAEARKIWPDVTTEEKLKSTIAQKFAADLTFPGWGLEFGHRALDDQRSFEQYGRKVTVRFVVLDSMISNGFISWLSDGSNIIGGWAGPPMTQIRREGAIGAWMSVADPERRSETDARIAAATARDAAAAAANPYGYFEGLAMRMQRRSNEAILAAVKGQGRPSSDLRLAFLARFEQDNIGCVQAHEARHLIEGATTSGMVRERNAALSQVIFGPHPVTCMLNMLAPNIGVKDNGSGEGYGEIMRGLARWMEVHAAEIPGLDRTRPLLPQFDRLSDEQIRTAFRSLDVPPAS